MNGESSGSSSTFGGDDSSTASLTSSLRSVVGSVRQTFVMLAPWATVNTDASPNPGVATLVGVLKTQARAYTANITTSLAVAENGVHLADNAIYFAKSVSSALAASQDTLPEKTRSDLLVYVDEMEKLAKEGLDAASTVERNFRNIRVTLNQLLQEPEFGLQGSLTLGWIDDLALSATQPSQPSRRRVDGRDAQTQLEAIADSLDIFLKNINQPIHWWRGLITDIKCIRTSLPFLRQNFNPLRSNQVIDKWTCIKIEYVHYSNEMSCILDYIAENPALSAAPPTVSAGMQFKDDLSSPSASAANVNSSQETKSLRSPAPFRALKKRFAKFGHRLRLKSIQVSH